MQNQLPLGEDPNRPVRLYSDGVFDMFHIGHAKQLEQCKKKFKYVTLIVGVSGQQETEKLKGATLMNEFERSESVRHCKWVDEVICPCPWLVTPKFLEEHNIDFVCHDATPPGQSGYAEDIYAPVKKLNKFLETQRTDGISTSDLIMRILKNRDLYIERSLSRGYKRQDLNMSFFDYLFMKSKQIFKKIEQKFVPCTRRKRNKQLKDQ